VSGHAPTLEQTAIIDAYRTGGHLVIEAGAGCLAADTVLHVNRGGKGSRMTIGHIARQMAGGARITRRLHGRLVEQSTKPWDPAIPTFLARAEERVVRLARLQEAWLSGTKKTFLLTTEGGRAIRATAAHPFLTVDGTWAQLSELRPGMALAVNTGLWQVGADRIVSLAPYGEELTYDVEIADSPHNFIANGFVVHNTGKTSTLKMLAAATPRRRGVYLAYNRAIAEDAKRSFPEWVTCATAHSFAFRAVGRQFSHRLNGPRLPAREAARILGIGGAHRINPERVLAPDQVARIVMETVGRFCHSADPAVARRHLPSKPGLDDPASMAALAGVVLPYAGRAWADLSRRDGQLKFAHDHYLKIYGLSGPVLQADYVLLDEAQDANPVVADIVGRQRAQRILVGDRSQAIYGWRGAVDAMSGFEGRRLTLSQSFRFGQAIADEANKWLERLEAPLRLRGYERIVSEVSDDLEAPDAILCRTNAEAVAQIMAAYAAGRRPALVGGGAEIRALAEAAVTLKAGLGTSHPELFAFRTWGELQEYVEQDAAGADLKVFVRLVDAHGPEVVIETVDRMVDERYADVVISTAHKAKGREWDQVRIAGDFQEPKEISPAELMLAYVAVTRAKLALGRGGLKWIDGPQPATEPEPELPLEDAATGEELAVAGAPRSHVPPRTRRSHEYGEATG
jgi:UvrD/REP helicase N-terminal domain/UvrD-like helicase C-terminal domain